MKNRHLWLRISAAALPEGFVEKLKDEFSWSDHDTNQAIEEYRRFVYLNQVADHPLSPPREVDQVWHMHLLYSRHYWGPWREILDTDIHHEPAKPSTPERAFWADYGATRDLYLQEFEHFAQEKYWPSVSVLKRRERIGAFAILCFFVAFLSIAVAVFTQNNLVGVIGVLAVFGFIGSLILAGGSGGGRKTSFGVSSGGGGDGGGCGD